MNQRGMAYRSVRLAALLAVMAGAAAAAPTALAQPQGPGGTYPEPDASKDGAAKYLVSKFLLEYEYNNEEHPSLKELFALPVTLGVLSDGGYTTADPKVHPGIPTEQITVGEALGDNGKVFYPGGISAVTEAIAKELVVNRKLIGVRVVPHPEDVAYGSGQDLRAEGNRRMRLKIFTAQLVNTQTINTSAGVDVEDRKNSEHLEPIRENSPLGVGGLIRRDRLDDYVLMLNRHPGRRVNVALVPSSEKPGEVELQYQVMEAKPWSVYAQVANIGTKSTDEWRERIGFAHTQLTNNDDVLRVDYLTAAFADTNSVFGSYERPFFNHEITVKVFGSWSEYSADQVGISGLEFTGESWSTGAEVAWTAYQNGASFVDAFAGLRYENVSVNNKLLAQEGQESFVIPSVGLRYARNTDNMSTSVSGAFDFGLGSLTGASTSELTKLGRIFPDKNWVAFKFEAEHSMYLEPLFYSTAYEDKDPNRLKGATLAHEVMLALRGQSALGKRLTPTFEGVAGGLYTVRGYPESVAAGDSSVVATAEYRFHLPRTLLTTDAEGNLKFMNPSDTMVFGNPFRVGPSAPFDRTDWDLIFKGFLDVGRTINSDRQVFEEDHSLVGAGVGVELQFLQNLNLRVDWGFAMHDVSGTENVKSGDSRVHFSATILY